jgi:integrase
MRHALLALAALFFCLSTLAGAWGEGIIESVRGKHPDFVFTFRGKPIETMNNAAWQRGRREAGLGDLHVHDLRHTVGMRLREAGVLEPTIADILWHARQGMTAHYSMAQITELRQALELIADERNRSNRSLASIVREAEVGKVPTKVLASVKTG